MTTTRQTLQPVRSTAFDPAGIFRLGNLSLSRSDYRVIVAGRRIDVTYIEFEILTHLAVSLDRVVVYGELTRSLWDAARPQDFRRLNVHVYRLRRKLAESWPYRIETVRGRGYGLLDATRQDEAVSEVSQMGL